MPERTWTIIVLGLGLLLLPTFAQTNSTENNPSPTPPLVPEVASLLRALNEAQREIQALREENARLRQSSTPTSRPILPSSVTTTPTDPPSTPLKPAAIPGSSAPAEQELLLLKMQNEQLQSQVQKALRGESFSYQPSVALSSLPPTTPQSCLEARDLAAYFRLDPAVAANRYQRKIFQVKGPIQRFDTGIGSRSLSIFLETVNLNIALECLFRMPERYVTVFTRRRDGALIGRLERNQDEVILRRGEIVTIEGECQSLEEGTIVFKSCRLIL